MSNRRTWMIAALLVALALTARLLPGARTIDDSFITFRYARNLLAGQGFVYNPGAPVLGTTTPLYTLLMAGLGALSIPFSGPNPPFPLLALGTNALADAAACLLIWQLGRRAGSQLAGLAAAFGWAVAPYSVTFAIGGLETSVYVLLLCGMALAYADRRRKLTVLCAALALLTRPDAVLLVGPLALDRVLRAWRGGPQERLTWGEVLVFGVPCAAWFGFATLNFGSPVPQSVQAKLLAYHLQPYEALVRLIQHYATPFSQQHLLGAPLGVGLGLALFPFLSVVGARRAWRSQPRLLAWLVYPWLYLLAFSLPNPLIFRWYLTPPLPAYTLCILLGLDEVLLALKSPRALRWALTAALPFVLLLSAWTLRPDHGPQRPAPDMAFIQLELLYRQVADELAPQMTPDSVLAAGDVGVLGYYTPGRILDTVGLNSPEASQYYPLPLNQYVINYAVAPDLIIDRQPDYVVILEVYGRRGLLQDARFLQGYHLLRRIDTDLYGSRGLLVWQRNAAQ